MRVDPSPTFESARRWRARTLLAGAILLAPFGLRVLWLEYAWRATEPCKLGSSYVTGEPGSYVLRVRVELDDPDCMVVIDASPPLATKQDAVQRQGTFPEGTTTTCHRVPRLCGAGIERPHVSAPFWALPIASVTLLLLGLARRRAPPAPPAPPPGGPFRAPAVVETEERPPLALRLRGSGIIAKIAATLFLVLPGLCGAPTMLYFHAVDPLNELALPLITVAMGLLTGAMLVGGIYLWWPRRRLVVDGAGRQAYRSAGIGPLELARSYARFGSTPQVSVFPKRARGRYGGEHTVGWELVLSDGAATLRLDVDDRDEGEALAKRVRAHLDA